MWSSLSSYLYNEDAKDVSASSPAAAVQRLPANTPVNLGTPSPRSSPLTNALSGVSNKGSAGKVNRSILDKPDNVSILRGVIVGLKGTGKTSLIRRLRGEDPFHHQQQQQSKSGQQRSSVDKRKLMALVPWNVPTDAEKINNLTIEQEERVQLYVSESASFLQSQEEQAFRKEWSTALQSQRGKEWNFIVWMIDPGMKDVLQYLQVGLEVLFPAAESEKATSSVQHLCILLNFRDTQQDTKSSILIQSREIIETVRKRVEMGQSEQKDDATGKGTKSPFIAVYESSMSNCYGLHQLHSFITLPYLAQKEEQLLRRAKLAQKQQLHLTKTLMESKVTDYSDFVASDNQVVVEEKPDKQTIERRKLEEEKERLKKQLMQQKEVLDAKMHRRKSPVIVGDHILSDEQPKESQVRVHNRKLFQTPSRPGATKPVVPTKKVGETSLESCFSEDESDDEVEAPRQIDKRSKSNVTKLKASSRVQVLDSDDSSSDSDDSDDDFYIDISGTRSSPFTKKVSPKIEPTVSEDSSLGGKSIIEEKSGGGKDESSSYENNENGFDQSESDAGSVHSDDSCAGNNEDEQDNAITPEPKYSDSKHDDDGNVNEDDNEGNNVSEISESNEDGESKNAATPSEQISNAGHEDGHSLAENEEEEEEEDAFNEGLEEENTAESSNTGDNEIKTNGEGLGVESKLPVEKTNAEDDTATAEVYETANSNGNTAVNDSSDTDSQVVRSEDTMEEEKTNSTPPKWQALEEDDEFKEDSTASASPQRCDHVSEEENRDTASALPTNNNGDESEDEFIVPAYEERQDASDDDEPSELGGDAAKPVREVDCDNDRVIEKTTNSASTLSKNSATVSRAALAAIEQARVEAEQMMAQSQPTKPKKEKKKKKDKVKKEKKAKKSKTKEESS
jgi:hypothetical protein